MIGAGTRILVCSQPQDMRRSFDRLAEIVRQLGEDPLSGAMYVFVGKRPTRLKVLWWDGSGLCLLYKRLNHAIFRMPAGAQTGEVTTIDGSALRDLLAGVRVDPKHIKTRDLH